MTDFPNWPCWMAQPDGTKEVFERAEDVPAGWMTIDQFNALDRDGDGVMGGSLPAAKPRGRPRKAAT